MASGKGGGLTFNKNSDSNALINNNNIIIIHRFGFDFAIHLKRW